MDPLPTPYDILPLPGLPISPGPLAWGVLLSMLAIGILLTSRKPRPSSNRFHVIQQAEKEIESLSLPLSKADLALLASRLRHVAEVLSGKPCTALTGQELVELSASTSQREIAALLKLIAELDQVRFAPTLAPEQATTFRTDALGVLRVLPGEPT